MLDDFPPFLSPRDPRDAYRESRTAHAVRSAGRPRRVVYLEAEDVPNPPELCTCHGESCCPDYLDAVAGDR